MTSENRNHQRGFHTKIGMHNRRAITLFACVFPLLSASFWVAALDEDTKTLPAQKCKVALEEGLQFEDSIAAPKAAPNPLPFPDIPIVDKGKRLPPIYREGDRVRAPRAYLPYDLSMQPLEGNPEDILAVGEALRKAEQGQRIRMTFFGASHTGGDYWTGHIRRVLQARYGDIGHGFTMPVPLYRSARANDINLCSTSAWVKDYVGYQDGHDDEYLAFGMSVSSDDPEEFAWLETTHQNPIGRNATFLDVYTLAQPDGGTLLAQIDQQQPFIIPTISDEYDLQQTKIETFEGPHRLTIRPAGDGEVRLFGISVENPGPGILVDSIGIRGREARTWLRWDEDIFTQAIQSLAPDVIVLAYGTNEANFVDNTRENYTKQLTSVLEKMRRALPDKACILVGPSDRGKKYKKGYAIWERTVMVAEVQREVAPNFGCVFWDWQQAQGGEGSMIAWLYTDPPLAAKDLIHHTSAGYIHIAERFIEALDDAKENYK